MKAKNSKTFNGKSCTSLSSLKFRRKSLNAPLRKHLIQTLAFTHFDYASIMFMNFDKTPCLQTAQNACIRFIFANIPRIPTTDITLHFTHHRLHLGWLTITSRYHS